MKGLEDSMLNDLDLKDKKQELENLKQKEEEVRNDIEELAEEYSLQLPDIIEASEKINKLPFETLKELYEFESGERKPYKKMVDIRAKLEEKRKKELNKLDSINADITMSKIDILLSEIESFSKKLD